MALHSKDDAPSHARMIAIKKMRITLSNNNTSINDHIVVVVVANTSHVFSTDLPKSDLTFGAAEAPKSTSRLPLARW